MLQEELLSNGITQTEFALYILNCNQPSFLNKFIRNTELSMGRLTKARLNAIYNSLKDPNRYKNLIQAKNAITQQGKSLDFIYLNEDSQSNMNKLEYPDETLEANKDYKNSEDDSIDDIQILN